MARAKKPKLPTAEKLLKQGDVQYASEAKAREGTRQRTKFEAENPERMQSIVDRPVGRESSRTGRELGMSPRLLYRLHGIEDTTSVHPHGQVELPGMRSVKEARHIGVLGTENSPMHQSRTLPDLAPTPTPWHDRSPKQNATTVSKLAEHGVTPESMHASFGAQLDQAHLRGQEHGQTPYAAHFYAGNDPSRHAGMDDMARIQRAAAAGHEGAKALLQSDVKPAGMQPRDVLLNSAQNNRVDFATQAVADGITSPKSKFSMESRSQGRTVYPNDQAASFAIQRVQEGVKPEHIDPSGHGIIALHNRVRGAGHAVQQRLQGAPVEDLRNPPSKGSPQGTSIFGPKTGPYTNSWVDPHGSSQHFVADVHSGGGGMAPHVSHENPYDRDEEGNIAQTAGGRNKKSTGSAREKLLQVPGYHALAHKVAGDVIRERGLQSISGAQAAQWGEEQVSRGAGATGAARKQTLVPTGKAYPTHAPEPQVHGQMDIYGGESRTHDVGVHTMPLNVAQFEVPTGKDRDREEAKTAAIQRNVRRKRGVPTHKELGNEPYEGWG